MRIVLSGPPSVGKTTQGRRLAEALDVPHISSGALIRSGAASGDPEAQALAQIVADGTLAPSDAIIRMVIKRLNQADCSDGFVLDGFPRKLEEARSLVATPITGALDAFFVLEATPDTLMKRVSERALQTSFVRADDDPEVFPSRIAIYEAETAPVREVMRSAGITVLRIDANDHSDTIHSNLLAALPRRPVLDLEQILLPSIA